MLEKEFEYYINNKDKFFDSYLGKFLVIKDESVLGVYQTQEEAITETLKANHKLGTFLVHLVSKDEPQSMYRSRTIYAR